MRAWVVREHGGVERLLRETREPSEPGAGEVRVAIRAAGLNHLDTWVRRGVPGHQFPLPMIVGSDGAGVVEATGPGVGNVNVGDAVVLLPGVSCGQCASCLAGEDNLCPRYEILGESRDGTCAESVVVPCVNVAPKPKGLDFAEAASITLVFQTAWAMLDKAGLRAGETILIHAGGSGVGSAAVQLARLRGARVFATAGSDAKAKHALALGADEAIDYRAVDFAAEVRRLTAKLGVDVVFEHVGAETFAGSMSCLARGGRVVTCGATTGGAVELSLHRLFFKNLSILGNTMGRKSDLIALLRLFEWGRLQPVLAKRLPFDQLAEGHRLLEERAVFGKVVIELPEPN